MPPQVRNMKALSGSLNVVPTFRDLTSNSIFFPALESSFSKKSNLLLKIPIKEGVLVTVQGISGALLAVITNLIFVTGGGMNNSTSLSITSSQLLVQTTTCEFWERAQAAYVEELRQCHLFKIGSKGSKNTSNAKKYSWHLILAQSLLQSSSGYLWSTAEPTQSRAEQSVIGRCQKGGSKRGEWGVELQGESLLDSKAAAQDFSHAALLCS